MRWISLFYRNKPKYWTNSNRTWSPYSKCQERDHIIAKIIRFYGSACHCGDISIKTTNVNLVVVLVIRLHQQRIINIFTALHDSSQNSWDISVNNSWCYTVVIHSRALNPMREKRWKYVIKWLLKQRAGKPNSVENAVCNCVSVLS